MYKTLIAAFVLCNCTVLQAQKTIILEERVIDSNPKTVKGYPLPMNEKTITIHLNGDKLKADKMVVEIDGKNIKINGKDIADLKDVNVNINENKFLYKNGNGIEMQLGKRPMQGRTPQIKILKENNQIKAILGIAMQKVNNGVKINEVNAESGAAKAGLIEGDIITAINGKKVATEMDITRIVNESKPADVLTIDYINNNKAKTTKATLGERKAEAFAWSDNMNSDMPFEMPMMPKMDMQQFENMDFDFNGDINGMKIFGNSGKQKPKLGVTLIETEDDKGLEVKDIEENSVAAKAGLQKGDIITTIGSTKVTNVSAVQQAIREAGTKPFAVAYLRNGKEQKTEIKFPKKLKEVNL